MLNVILFLDLNAFLEVLLPPRSIRPYSGIM